MDRRGRCLCLRASLNFLPIKLEKIDTVQIQLWESAVTRHIANNSADIWEQHARAFDQCKRMDLFFRNIAQLKQPAIFKFKKEQGFTGFLGLG